MEVSHLTCRLCLSVTDFNVSLFGSYCRKTNMLDKILVCLKLVIEETDHLHTICYKCAESIERFYDFIAFVKKTQTKLCDNERFEPKSFKEPPADINRRHVTSYVREQVFDADYTFSFLEMSNNDEKKEAKISSPFFSYFSPPNVVLKSSEPRMWKTPRPRSDDIQKTERKKPDLQNKIERPRQHSRDLFESQSQDAEEVDTRCLDWKLTPDENIMRRVRQKCFGPSDF